MPIALIIQVSPPPSASAIVCSIISGSTSITSCISPRLIMSMTFMSQTYWLWL